MTRPACLVWTALFVVLCALGVMDLQETLKNHALWLSENGGSRADLSGADLSDANLRGANLRGTCLSTNLGKLARKFAKECPATTTGGRIVYRTKKSQHVGSTRYEIGKTYIAPALSWSVETECHPGIYAASLRWMKENYPYVDLVRCYVRDGDWTITAKGAIRCSRIRVLSEYIEE